MDALEMLTVGIETASIVSGIFRLTPSPAGRARPREPLALRLNYGVISASILTRATRPNDPSTVTSSLIYLTKLITVQALTPQPD